MAFLIILLVVVALIAVSVALGRTTREAQSVRDDEFVELEGSWIRYRVAGEGPPVLLVHGLLSSSRIWDSLAGRLSERFTVYSLDLRGFGESDKPITGYGVRHGSRLMHAFCDRFKLGKVALVGHDVGGDMAVKLAADHPEMVSSVTVVAAPADDEQIDLPTSLWLATLPVVGPLFYVLGQYAAFVRRLWLKPFVADRDDLPEEFVEDAANSTPAALRLTFNTVKREISRERITRQSRHLKSPMLVVCGEQDEIVDPKSADAWSRTASRSEVALLDRCGHLPMIELPEEFNARMLAFLTGDERYLSEIRPRRATGNVAADETRPADDPDETEGMEPEPASPPQSSGQRARNRPRERRERESGYEAEPDAGLPSQPEESTGGEPVAGDHEPEERGRTSRRSSGRPRDTLGEGLIPELPDDLFSWSGVRDERRRSRGASRSTDEAPEEKADPKSANGGEPGGESHDEEPRDDSTGRGRRY